jgi:hypothetical protein
MDTSQPHPRPATLEPVRFGEFLLLRHRISDEQWLAALAGHWSSSVLRRRRIGRTIVEYGFLPAEVVEEEARVFHDEIEVVEIVEVTPRSERPTLPPPHRPRGAADKMPHHAGKMQTPRPGEA